ncbi:hypothetical protein U0033_26610 [Chitinophaga sancti]|uniref:Uncharacterized protein n=3 Tax=Chitinophaga sancti TaxID=1004 RepID=A0ABZ0XQM4_9BACT|nr:hypothetical protein [Chitinophaga sancti]WQD61453.1 hypothetical protein U0033_26610 [Chitinophaga sancti]WQG92990.1 hypothetical protein SR876_15830 [Chitinophaga sancti]
MACESIIALAKSCGENKISGVQNLYIIRYADLVETNGSTYTVSTAGLISDINIVTAKQFVPVGLLKNTAVLNETLNKNLQTGTSYMTQTFTLVLSDLTTENKTFIESVMNQEVAIVIRTKTGKYYAAGLNGQMELSALEGGTGTAEADLIGHTLTFTGTDTKLIQQVDSSLISTITAPAS